MVPVTVRCTLSTLRDYSSAGNWNKRNDEACSELLQEEKGEVERDSWRGRWWLYSPLRANQFRATGKQERWVTLAPLRDRDGATLGHRGVVEEGRP